MMMTDIEPGSDEDAEFLKSVLELEDIASFNQFGVRVRTRRAPSPQLTAKGPSTILFTRGAACVIGANTGTSLQGEGHKVEVVVTTGAGDPFHAGFSKDALFGLAQEDALAYAYAVGALSVTASGPRACYRITQRLKHASASEGHESRIEPPPPLYSCSGERTNAH